MYASSRLRLARWDPIPGRSVGYLLFFHWESKCHNWLEGRREWHGDSGPHLVSSWLAECIRDGLVEGIVDGPTHILLRVVDGFVSVVKCLDVILFGSGTGGCRVCTGIFPIDPWDIGFEGVNGDGLDHAEESIIGRLLWCRDGLNLVFKMFR